MKYKDSLILLEKTQNPHLEHLDDEILNFGSSGGRRAINTG